jgi:UDP-N-acetylmuramate dehydrogenase
MAVMAPTLPLETLRQLFGERLREDAALARYTSARIGGPADALIEARSASELAETAAALWELQEPFIILGGGSNVLVSDAGVRQVVVLNHARKVRFGADAQPPSIWAESGANLGAIARQAAGKGLGGLEWAAGIPGTLGGAVFGNAGAHGGDMSASLLMADILHREQGRQDWSAAELEFAYRSSRLKREADQAIVLSASLRLEPKPDVEIRKEMDAFLAYRRLTQPPGASMGSMFKNPPGEHAGRLIEEAGLKGRRIGTAQISPLHANFFLNLGDALAADVYALIDEARRAVKAKSGVDLELEVELVGDWPAVNNGTDET